MKRNTRLLAAIVVFTLPSTYVFGFTTVSSPRFSSNRPPDTTSLNAQGKCIGSFLASAALISAIALGSNPVLADEYGRETEAPTLFTGETVMVSLLRGLIVRFHLESSDRTMPFTKPLCPDLREAWSPWSLYTNGGTNGKE
jgi:hypothetical protein